MSKPLPPKSPFVFALWVIPFAALMICLFLVTAAQDAELDAAIALGAWADILMNLAVVSLVGALVLSGVLHALPVVAETYGLKHGNETSKASGSEGE